MKAMVLKKLCNLKQNQRPLELMDMSVPIPCDREILVKISACAVCHTELDEIEGRTAPPRLPVVPGHQVVGRVEAVGSKVNAIKTGDRVGVAWIFSACGRCKFCLAGTENLCPAFEATGRDANGGYAQYMVVAEDFAYAIPDIFSDVQAAPLLCAGAIGFRSLRLTGLKDGQILGLTGFGASAHLVLKMVQHRYPHTKIYVFARSAKERAFVGELGAVWTGDVTERAPHQLDCIIDTTPAWEPVVAALANLESGGRLVINAIRKEGDNRCLLNLAAKINLQPEVQLFALEQANEALLELKAGKIRGAKVLKID